MPQVSKLRESFGLEQVVLVGDRGMISHKAITELRELEGLSWITALKSVQIRSLVEGEVLQQGLFDERNLVEIAHPDYPGERLVACRNPELAKMRGHKRQSSWRRQPRSWTRYELASSAAARRALMPLAYVSAG
jgi:hypothetical protein